MRGQGIALLILLLVNAARSMQEEKSANINKKRGVGGAGDLAPYINNSYGHSGRPLNPSYSDFTTPSPFPVPLPPTVTVARPYPTPGPRPNIPRPYTAYGPHTVPYGVPGPRLYPGQPPAFAASNYPIPPNSPFYPTYPSFNAVIARIHDQWSHNKRYGGPANAYSSGFDASAVQGYGLGDADQGLPLAPPMTVSYTAPYTSYAPNPTGLPATIPVSKLSLIAAGLAAYPDIALAAASAQHRHPGNPGAYHELPGGPTRTGLLAARLAAYPEIALAAAAAQKHHAQPNAYTANLIASHPDITAAAMAAQHAHHHALTGSDFIARLAGAPTDYVTAAAAAHLGYGAHPAAHVGGSKINNFLNGLDYAALHKFAALKGHGAFHDYSTFGNAAQRYARKSKN